ncbi:MAG: NAD-dependent protein deacylase [Oscillospiraceae bacterium]|nr:NAD-dependent protein deacylase [Oscillospiraceae bacterium]MBR0450938.1 NAD-dependent protein deacylase [Oscillospiraceae bacterium]
MNRGTPEQLNQLVAQSSNVVFFGGAGVSVPSGIPDFRSDNGIYKQKYRYPAEVMLSHDFFFSRTEEFYDFYRNVMLYPDAKPNAAHLKLAELEKAGKLKAVITQNIDGLHQAAGSKNVLELHGSVHRNYCIHCDEFYPLDTIIYSTGIPKCEKCGGIIKPDVVLYGEGLDQRVISESVRAIERCDLLIVGGTSLSVWPAAGLIQYMRRDAKLAIVNLSPTDADRNAQLVIQEGIDSVFSKIEV